MVSAQALVRDNEKTLKLLQSVTKDRPLGAQLLGCDPEIMAEAAQIIESLGFDLLDLNLGCPVRKVVSNGEGASLLRNPNQAEKVFKAVRRAVKKMPLTVKMRKGFEDESGKEAAEIAKRAEDCGFDAVTVHGRTQKQGYSGLADYEAIAVVKAAVKIPLIGNGDVTTPETAKKLKAISGCDGIMIGRGGLGNPWIYRNLDRALESSARAGANAYEEDIATTPYVPSIRERSDTLLKHLELELLYLGEREAALNSRRIVVWYTAGLPNSKNLRVSVCGTMDFDLIRRMTQDFFATLPEDAPPPQTPLLLAE
jgi:nifR3 family TIM-barrel protein